MTYEDQDIAEARRTGGHDHQGRLSLGGGCSEVAERPPQALWRLKRSISLYPAPDGALYLVRLGAGDDQVIEDPTPIETSLLTELSNGFAGLDELESRLGQMGHRSAKVDSLLEDLLDAGLVELRQEPRALSHSLARRFDRQLIYLADLAPARSSADDLQTRLTEAQVLIIGCGGLGSWAATGLSLCGVGSLILIDDDVVETSNLNRQLLFNPNQVGQLKVNMAKESLQRHNPELEVLVYPRRIRSGEDLKGLLEPETSIVISTGDWPPHDLPRWVNQVAVDRKIPWIGAGQFPPRLRVGPLVVPGQTACLECMEAATRSTHPLYERIAGFRDLRPTPDPSVGPVTGVIGSLLASEVMHFLLGSQPASLNQALLLDLQTMTLDREPIVRRSDCTVCGELSRPRSEAC